VILRAKRSYKPFIRSWILVVAAANLCSFFTSISFKWRPGHSCSKGRAAARTTAELCHPAIDRRTPRRLVNSMFATVLGSIVSRHRAWAIALLWLLILTILNVQTGGAYRSTVLFAIPVAVVSWSDWRLGFLFAAFAVIAAEFSGAMQEPGPPSPVWLEGMAAFIKLSIDAAVVNAWGRRHRRRTAQSRRSEDLPRHSGN
jgi:hypothetical protein